MCNKLKVTISKYHKFENNFIAARVSFTSRKTAICGIFPPIGLTKTIVIPLFFKSYVENLVWNVKWHHSWH